MNNNLTDERCLPCEGGMPALTQAETQTLCQHIPEWKLAADNQSISRQFSFKGFYQTMGFINLLAWIAQQERHHPDVQFGYNHCTVTYTTHAISGLSRNDFICATKIDQALVAPPTD